MVNNNIDCFSAVVVYLTLLTMFGILFVNHIRTNLNSTNEVFRHLDNKIKQKWTPSIEVLNEKRYKKEPEDKSLKRVTFNISKTPEIVCIDFTGRLGNLMYGYAFLYAMARSKGLFPVIPDDSSLSKFFNVQNTTLSSIGKSKKACATLPSYKERWALSYDEKLTQVPQIKGANFFGYFQSWKYWIPFEEEIRDVFQFNEPIKSKAVAQFNAILRQRHFTIGRESVVVSIHVRREDYLSKENIKFGYLIPNATYFRKAMRYFRKKFKNVFFIVGSNDIPWCREALAGEPNVHFSVGNSAVEDMALLSLSNHTIASVGTYGWWIGWMAGGITLYYKNMFVPGSDFAKTFRNESTEDFIYPGWILME